MPYFNIFRKNMQAFLAKIVDGNFRVENESSIDL